MAGLLLLAPATAAAQPTAQVVQAAFLPKFARYVTWPPAARPEGTAPLQLCVVGTDGFGALLDRAVTGQSVDQHAIVIRRLASPEQAGSCHIAFVNGASPQATAAILAALRGKPVLTVTDSQSGAARGMINFVIQDGRVRFYIDAVIADDSRIAIDSRLLSIALGVRQKRP